jgi:predicted DNA-binding transcriptional regulator AlpA
MNAPSCIFPAAPLFESEQRFQRPRRAMELAGVSKSTLYRLLRAGKIKGRKVGRMTVIDMASIAALFEASPEIMPKKHIEARTITASQLGMDEPPDLPAPPDPDGPLSAFTLGAIDLDELASLPSEAPDERQ